MDRFDLFSAMLNRKVVEIHQYKGIIQSIQMEDGSGYNFNIVLSMNGKNETVFLHVRKQSLNPQ